MIERSATQPEPGVKPSASSRQSCARRFAITAFCAAVLGASIAARAQAQDLRDLLTPLRMHSPDSDRSESLRQASTALEHAAKLDLVRATSAINFQSHPNVSLIGLALDLSTALG